jgi:hypothetical protein
MTRGITPAATPATDTQSIKRSRQDDLALLGTLRADTRLPNRARRIRALCYALDVPILPGGPRRLRSMASPSSRHDPHRHHELLYKR